jgi:hypothetical protein
MTFTIACCSSSFRASRLHEELHPVCSLEIAWKNEILSDSVASGEVLVFVGNVKAATNNFSELRIAF